MPNYIAKLRPVEVGPELWREQMGSLYLFPIAPPDSTNSPMAKPAFFFPDDTETTYMSQEAYREFGVASKVVLELFIRNFEKRLEACIEIPTDSIVLPSEDDPGIEDFYIKVGGKLMVREFSMDWSRWPLKLSLTAKKLTCRPWGRKVAESASGR